MSRCPGVDRARRSNRDEAGEPTDAGPNVIPPFRFTWLTIGYHVTGRERFKVELQKWLRNNNRTLLKLSSIGFMNRYAQYYGNCLAHEYYYNLLRLGKAYYSEDDYLFVKHLFDSQGHTFTRLSHNPFFNGIFMSQGDYQSPADDDPHQDQLVEDLTAFMDAPHYKYYLPERDPLTYDIDPLSVFLHDLIEDFPFIGDIIGNVDYQANEAFPVDLQCHAGFSFQQNPFKFEACGADDPSTVTSGVDFLISYWMAAYHKFVAKDM